MKFRDLSSDRKGEPSTEIRKRVQKARDLQLQRFNEDKHTFCNADMQSKQIRKYCHIDETGSELLKNAITKLGLSARAYDRILKVSCSIADLSGSESILPEHMS